jgi:hypothetical protein
MKDKAYFSIEALNVKHIAQKTEEFLLDSRGAAT